MINKLIIILTITSFLFTAGCASTKNNRCGSKAQKKREHKTWKSRTNGFMK